MNPAMVRARVEAIRAAAGDSEAAHAMQDDLFSEVLGAIASGGCTNPEACAAEALKAEEIEFERWCA